MKGRTHSRTTFHHPEVGPPHPGYQSMQLEGTPSTTRWSSSTWLRTRLLKWGGTKEQPVGNHPGPGFVS